MKRKITLILTPIILFVLYLSLSSNSGGINGQSVAGCTCHGSPSPSTLVTISGLPSGGYTNGTVYPITVSVTNTTLVGVSPNFLGDGFNMTASSGAFTAIAGTSLNGATEIRHNVRKAPTAGTASWTFNWTAPAAGSNNISFAVSGNATNGNGNTNGDAWNQTSSTLYKAGAVLTVNATAPSITCNGGVSSITATAFGPSVPYMYQLNSGAFQSSGTFTNNLAGTYTVTVRNSALVTASTVVTITQPTAITVSATNTPINCNGGTSTITASAGGGTGALQYRLNLGVFQTSPIFNSNLAATYTVTARDASLCTKTTTIVITQPLAMVFTAPSIVNPVCNGGTGSVSTTASNGVGTKTYTINPLGPQSNTTGSFTGLSAQNYTITVTDGNSCTKTTLVTITQPAAINFNLPTLVSPNCFGGVGSATLTTTGGVGTKTYSITPSGPQSNTTGIFTGLAAQTYTVTVADANSCTKTTVFTMSQPTAVTFVNSSVSPPLCAGGLGSFTIVASGGTGSKVYSVMPGSLSSTNGLFLNLTAQTYTVTATDGVGCATTSLITIPNIPPITFNATSITNALCNGGNGSATVSTNGGNGAMSYSWKRTINLTTSKDNSIFEQNQNNSNGAGEFMYAGKLANGFLNRALLQFDLSAIPVGATITEVSLTMNCSNSAPGSGAQPLNLHKLTQSWGEGTSNAGSPGGTGTAATTDDATWQSSKHPSTAWTTLGGAFNPVVSGTTLVNAVGSYTWSSPGMVSDIQSWYANTSTNFGWLLKGQETAITQAKRFDTKENITSGITPSLSITFSISGNSANQNNLTAGNYTVIATDANNCTASTSFSILEPNAINIGSPAVTDPLCHGGTGDITLEPSGGIPSYSYNWNNSVTLTTSKDNSIFQQNQSNSNGAGEFMYAGKLANGFLNRALLQFDLSSIPSGATITSASLTLNCSNIAPGSGAQPMNLHKAAQSWGEGTSDAGTPGGTGISATTNDATWINRMHPSTAWSTAGGDFNTTVSGSTLVNGLGFYTWSSAGMISDLQSWLNNPSSNFGWLLKGQETAITQAKRFDTKENIVQANRPSLVLTYTLSNSGTQTNLVAGTYSVTVSDANNCSASTTITLTDPPPVVANATNVTGCIGSPITLSGTPAGGVFSVLNPYTGPSTTYTYTYTDGNGCIGTSSPATITVDTCAGNTILNMNIFIEGYFIGSATMVPTLMNQGVGTSATDVDSVTILLKDQITFATVDSAKAVLQTNGTVSFNLGTNVGTYYLATSHRNALSTWSAAPVTLVSGINSYNFTNAATQAYGNNMKEVETGVWALYSGELNYDENIDLLDLSAVETDVSNFQFGYFATDLNGDGNVDLLDTPVLEGNVSNFVFANHP